MSRHLRECAKITWHFVTPDKSWAVIDRPYSPGPATVGALYERPGKCQVIFARSLSYLCAAALAVLLVSPMKAQQGQRGAPPAPAAGSSGAIQKRIAPPARILEFRAEPQSIKPGESALLTWAVENPIVTTMDPEPGRVAPRGNRRVTPKESTTYTLTVTGPNGATTRAVTVTVAGAAAVAAKPADAPAGRTIPRTPDGKPDFTGVYGNAGLGTPAPQPQPISTLPRTPTLKPGAEKYRVVRGPTDAGQYATCMPPGIPQTFAVPYHFQIVQAPRHVVILHEYLHLFRVIPTDGTPLPPDPDPFWMGHAVGRWEGDTLVVESAGYNDRTEISGYRHTEALRITERFRRVDYDTLQYEAVIEDPDVFEGPWVVARSFAFRPEFDKIDEFVCENNPDYRELYEKK
jgi:hypothetical protein